MITIGRGKASKFEEIGPGGWYSMEPGDGTLYTFSVQHIDDTENTVIFPGSAGGNYTIITIYMASGTGMWIINDGSLDNLDAHVLFYLLSKSSEVYAYTLAIVLCAASVLYLNPYNVNGALKEMLAFYKGEKYTGLYTGVGDYLKNKE